MSGTGSNLMFFFPYTRYILEAGAKWIGGDTTGPVYPNTLPPVLPSESRSVLPTHTPPHLVT